MDWDRHSRLPKGSCGYHGLGLLPCQVGDLNLLNNFEVSLLKWPVELVERIFPFGTRDTSSQGPSLHTAYPPIPTLLDTTLDGARPRSLPAGGYEPPCRQRYTVKRSVFTPTQIWYHCVRTTFVNVGKTFPLNSMHSNSRYQHLNLLSEIERPPFCLLTVSGMETCGLLNGT